MATSTPEQRDMSRRWLIACGLGWLAGFVLVLVLAVAMEAVAGGVQVVVGLGMGAGLGHLQGRLLAERLGSPWPWTWSATVGMAIPFLAHDILAALGVDLPTALWVYVPLGGVLVVAAQHRLLAQASLPARAWWLPGVSGWIVPVALIGIGDALHGTGPLGGILSLVGMFGGGVLYGAVTARPMATILARGAVR